MTNPAISPLPPERLPRRAVRGAGAHSPRFVQLIPAAFVPRRFCLPAGLRGAERRCGSFSDPQRRAAGWVGAMWRSIAPARATIPPPHSTHEDRLSHYDGGAQGASAGTSTTLGFTNQRDGDFSKTRPQEKNLSFAVTYSESR